MRCYIFKGQIKRYLVDISEGNCGLMLGSPHLPVSESTWGLITWSESGCAPPFTGTDAGFSFDKRTKNNQLPSFSLPPYCALYFSFSNNFIWVGFLSRLPGRRLHVTFREGHLLCLSENTDTWGHSNIFTSMLLLPGRSRKWLDNFGMHCMFCSNIPDPQRMNPAFAGGTMRSSNKVLIQMIWRIKTWHSPSPWG